MRALIVGIVVLGVSVCRPVPARADEGEQPAWRDPDLPPLPGAATAEPGRGDASSAAAAQARNAVFLELGGSGLAYSVNYERFVSDWFALRVGFGAVVALVVPMTASFLIRNGNHALELGAGAVSIWDRWNNQHRTEQYIVGTAIIGYRFVPPGGGPMFRIAYTPFLGSATERVGADSWFGFAFGATL